MFWSVKFKFHQENLWPLRFIIINGKSLNLLADRILSSLTHRNNQLKIIIDGLNNTTMIRFAFIISLFHATKKILFLFALCALRYEIYFRSLSKITPQAHAFEFSNCIKMPSQDNHNRNYKYATVGSSVHKLEILSITDSPKSKKKKNERKIGTDSIFRPKPFGLRFALINTNQINKFIINCIEHETSIVNIE